MKTKALSAAERAEQELAAFKGLQDLDIDHDAPAALKASPSGSESESAGMHLLSLVNHFWCHDRASHMQILISILCITLKKLISTSVTEAWPMNASGSLPCC